MFYSLSLSNRGSFVEAINSDELGRGMCKLVLCGEGAGRSGQRAGVRATSTISIINYAVWKLLISCNLYSQMGVATFNC